MTTKNAAKAAEYSAHPTTHPENTQQDLSTQDSNPTSRSMRDSNPTLTQKLKSLNPQTQKAAKQAAEGFNGFLKNTFINMLEQGQRLNELQTRMQSELGKKEGSIAFKIWLNSEEWDYTRTLAKNLMTVAKKYSKLPGKLKNQLRDKLNGWSLTAIKELLSAGKDIINKFKNRPTSAAAIQRAKKEEARKQQPVNDWTEVQKLYENLTAEDLEAIKEEAEKDARQHNRTVQIKDVEKVADEFGFKKVKQRKTKDVPLNSIKERIANYAIRNAQLEEDFKTAPENLKDDLALQIQSCRNAIAQLSKGLEAPEEISPEEIGPNPELLQRIADLEALVETLHRQNEDLIAKNSYSEPAPTAPDSTRETLEQKLREQNEAIALLKKQNEELEQKLDATIEIVPTQPYNPVITPPTSDIPENVALETPPKLKPTKAALKAIAYRECDLQTLQQNQSLEVLLKDALLTIEDLEDHEKTWERRYGKALGKINRLKEDGQVMVERDRNALMKIERLERTLEELLNLPQTKQQPQVGDTVLVICGNNQGMTGVFAYEAGENSAVIEQKAGDRTFTITEPKQNLINLKTLVTAK